MANSNFEIQFFLLKNIPNNFLGTLSLADRYTFEHYVNLLNKKCPVNNNVFQLRNLAYMCVADFAYQQDPIISGNTIILIIETPNLHIIPFSEYNRPLEYEEIMKLIT